MLNFFLNFKLNMLISVMLIKKKHVCSVQRVLRIFKDISGSRYFENKRVAYPDEI